MSLVALIGKYNIPYNDCGLSLKDTFSNHLTGSSSFSSKDFADLHNYYWHAYSFNKISCLTGDNAKKTLLSLAMPNQIYIYIYNMINVECIMLCGLLKFSEKLLEDLQEYSKGNDMYIVHKNSKWVYVTTHEVGFGPYFSER